MNATTAPHRIRVEHGDCLDVMPRLLAEGVQVDAIVTDPPYHLTSIVKRFGGRNAAPAQEGTDGLYARASRGFMGKTWDGGDIAFRPETWAHALRLLKPGGHLVAFAAPRNMGRMQVAIEEAGFELGTAPVEVRDTVLTMMGGDTRWTGFLDSLSDEQASAFAAAMVESDPSLLAWVFGCGFPKSHNIGKAIDKMLGAERPVVGVERISNDIRGGAMLDCAHDGNRPGYDRAVTAAATDEARRWEGWGTALKPAFEPIILARKPLSESSVAANVLSHGTGALNVNGCRIEAPEGAVVRLEHHETGSTRGYDGGLKGGHRGAPNTDGRWPANVIHDGGDEVIEAFPIAPGQRAQVGPQHGAKPSVHIYSDYGLRDHFAPRGDAGTAARFFYSAKADASDRLGSKHPTVKPVDLVAWLCRLICPPGGTVLDPFAGSGSTGMACLREGFNALLIEREAEYVADILRRIGHVQGADTPLFGGEAAK